MIELFTLALMGAVIVLFRRVTVLQASIEELQDALDALRHSATQPIRDEVAEPEVGPAPTETEPQDEPQAGVTLRRSAVSVPSVMPKVAGEPALYAQTGDEAAEGSEPSATVAADTAAPAADAHADIYPAEPPPPGAQRFRFDFEDIFGRRLPIWAGGITLAVTGVLLVGYSIEAGLLTPPVRVAMSFLFGAALLIAAEFAYRLEDKVRDPRVRQALAGAGLATLYAAFYLAGTQYGLIGQGAAFVGLALVTGGAIALSFRFGLPSAVLGLVGGFAAPALVGGDDANLPLLALYLGLVTAGLSWTGQRQQRPWLGLTALAGGLGWGALMLLTEDFGVSDILALGLYFVVLGAVLPTLVSASGMERPLRLVASAVAAGQLAALVARTVHDPLAWGLYLLLGATLAFFGWRKPALRESSGVAAAISVALLVLWESPQPVLFAPVAAALALLFAGVPLVHIWLRQHRLVDIAMACALPLALGGAVFLQFGEFSADPVQPILASGFLLLAAFPALAAYRLRRSADDLVGLFAALGTGALLALGAILLVTPGWAAPLAASAILAGLIAITRRHGAAALADLSWLAWIVALLTLIATPHFIDELLLLFGEGAQEAALRALLRWGSFAAVTGLLAFNQAQATRRAGAAVLTALAGYGAIAQIVPAPYLGLATATLAVAINLRLSGYRAAGWAMLAVSLAWAAGPFILWCTEGVQSLGGYPVLRNNLPGVPSALLRLVPVSAALAFMASSIALPGKVRDAGFKVSPAQLARGIAAGMAIVALHILFKQGFDIATLTSFEALGLAERTVWQALLLAGAALAARRLPAVGRQGELAVILAGAALAHFMLYSLGLHNPLWDRQAVGPTPIANLALLASIVGIAAAIILRRLTPQRIHPALDGPVMIIASFGALAVLRQVFAGSILIDTPLGQTEDLLRSLTGIVLALAFLFIGSRTGNRSWRIGSLVLMLIAVVKVFVFDTAGLEGLLRIASFLALGLSLLGLGWFYSRVLGSQPEERA